MDLDEVLLLKHGRRGDPRIWEDPTGDCGQCGPEPEPTLDVHFACVINWQSGIMMRSPAAMPTFLLSLCCSSGEQVHCLDGVSGNWLQSVVTEYEVRPVASKQASLGSRRFLLARAGICSTSVRRIINL